jgi:hypothetical protein
MINTNLALKRRVELIGKVMTRTDLTKSLVHIHHQTLESEAYKPMSCIGNHQHQYSLDK